MTNSRVRASWGRAALLGPLAGTGRTWRFCTLALVATALLVTQVGAPAVWIAAGLAARRRRRAIVLLAGSAVGMAVALGMAHALAPTFGRVPLPCLGDALASRSVLYCAAARNFVVPELRDELVAVAEALRAADPQAEVRTLDGGFPFGGLPLLPHLSHHDGRKVDLALPMQRRGVLKTRGSPLGYFGYVAPPGNAACPERWWDLRWDFGWMQPLLGPPELDEPRARALVAALVRRPAVGKILLEPHLRERLRADPTKVRFQGCRAARHDDHLHAQLR